MSGLERHLHACNNLSLPGGLTRLRLGRDTIGWLGPTMLAALGDWPDLFRREADALAVTPSQATPDAVSAALAGVVTALAGRGLLRDRHELFDIRATPEGPVLGQLDRGALPPFGVMSQGVHVNGRVRRPDGLHLWMGWRSKDKAIAPGQLDNLVAGGIPAGLGPLETLAKEAGEEASVPPALARQARPVGRISYVMANGDGARVGGTRRDVLHCYDLDLPEDFVPRPNDDEVERFELWPAARVLEAVRDTDTVKFNVNLVLIDLFLREGLIDPDSAEGRRLRAGLDAGVGPEGG
ncbi:DUF4743 domain-containing protein [Roseomonas sp. NAR14]|uniref:DUF4743 domain-containing protein n=1 Tax=Roseomonas acroporae TaxID=2937791 RepID=A0A9X1Y3B2_9PROT|nr:DUF4743 domain-containing protein [Roseomonas acroporae]MCK8783394.1 DUF4743 domain-containing protein [Roseomonas acroporae]